MIWRSVVFLLPHEHGAWGILTIPLAIGTIIAPSRLAVALWICAFSFFILRTAWLRWLKGQTLDPGKPAIILLAPFTLVTGLPLLVAGRWGLVVLLAMAAAAGALEAFWPDWTRRYRLLRHLIDVGVLTALAPAVIYTSRGRLDLQAGMAWLSCAAYFSWRTWEVKQRVAVLIEQKRFGDIQRTGWREVRYSLAFAVITALGIRLV